MSQTRLEFFPEPLRSDDDRVTGLQVAIAFPRPLGIQKIRYRRRRFKISVVYGPDDLAITKVKLSPWAYVPTDYQIGGSLSASLSPVGPGGGISIQKKSVIGIEEFEGRRGAYNTYSFSGPLPLSSSPNEKTILTVSFNLAVRRDVQNLPIWIEVDWLGKQHFCHVAGTLSSTPAKAIPVLDGPKDEEELVAITPYFFERIGIPAVILEGDGIYEFRDDSSNMIRAKWYPGTKYTLDQITPPELRSLCIETLEDKKRIADERALVFFNGQLARLMDYRPLRDDLQGFRGIELRLQATDYHTFVATNHALESPFAEQAVKMGLVEAERRAVANLRDSILANPITVLLNIVTREPDGSKRLIIQKRNPNKVMHCWQHWQSSAGGMVDMPPDTATSYPNPFFTAAVREIKQETGIEVKLNDIKFLALVRDTRFYEVGLIGEVSVNHSYRKVLSDIADIFEAESFIAIPFTPGDFVSFIRKIGREELEKQGLPRSRTDEIKSGLHLYAPLALAGVLISLVHGSGSAHTVEQAFLDE